MTPIEKALKTWYPPDHFLHNDPLHPAIGLAGEAGELLDLYKKERFKEGFSWWDCVHCNRSQPDHHTHSVQGLLCHGVYPPVIYTSKILDEFGDLWYYLRILAYQSKWKIPESWETGNVPEMFLSISDTLIKINFRCGKLLKDYENVGDEELTKVFILFLDLVLLLDTTLNQLTELNWKKLKDGDNHGWATTRVSL